MGRPEGALRDERHPFAELSCHGVYLCGLQALGKRERWEDRGQTLCHHRLSASRRTYHHHVVTAGGSHFHGTLHVLLSAHVGEIEIEIRLLFVEFAPRVNPRWFKFCRAVDESDYIGKTVHAIHVDIVHHRRLTDVLARHDESLELLFPGTDGYGQGTAYGLQPAVETKFSDKHVFVEILRLHLLHGGKDTYRQWQVVATALLAKVGGSHVHRDVGNGEFVSVVEQCRNDAVVAFLHRRIGES